MRQMLPPCLATEGSAQVTTMRLIDEPREPRGLKRCRVQTVVLSVETLIQFFSFLHWATSTKWVAYFAFEGNYISGITRARSFCGNLSEPLCHSHVETCRFPFQPSFKSPSDWMNTWNWSWLIANEARSRRGSAEGSTNDVYVHWWRKHPKLCSALNLIEMYTHHHFLEQQQPWKRIQMKDAPRLSETIYIYVFFIFAFTCTYCNSHPLNSFPVRIIWTMLDFTTLQY